MKSSMKAQCAVRNAIQFSQSCRVLLWSGCELRLEINLPSQQIHAKRKGGLINEGGVISSEYSIERVS